MGNSFGSCLFNTIITLLPGFVAFHTLKSSLHWTLFFFKNQNLNNLTYLIGNKETYLLPHHYYRAPFHRIGMQQPPSSSPLLGPCFHKHDRSLSSVTVLSFFRCFVENLLFAQPKSTPMLILEAWKWVLLMPFLP